MVGLVLVYVAFFALGSGPVTWVLLAEVLPPSIKGPAASLATAAGWAGKHAASRTLGKGDMCVLSVSLCSFTGLCPRNVGAVG